jgi:hypothetical protein
MSPTHPGRANKLGVHVEVLFDQLSQADYVSQASLLASYCYYVRQNACLTPVEGYASLATQGKHHPAC